MADNITVNVGAGATVATDECTINGVVTQVPRGKLGFGPDGTYTEVTAAAPLPVTSAIQTGAVGSGGALLTVKYAPIAATASGNATVVPAVAGKKVRVLEYALVTSAAAAVKFTDAAGGAGLTGVLTLGANGGIGAAFCPVGLFETSAGNALVLNVGATATVGGHLAYVEV